MNLRGKPRVLLALVLSLLVHLAISISVYRLPEQSRTTLDTVDILISRTIPQKAAPPEPPPEKAEPEFVPAHKLRATRRKPPKIKTPPPPKEPPAEKEAGVPPPALPPDAEKAPPEAPAAKPVFDLGDNTFAARGKGSGWSLNRSEGNSKFAAVAPAGAENLRGTRPKGVKDGVPGGTGDGPVRIVDLSRRPMPVSGFRIPPYPLKARQDGIEGEVVLKVYVDKTGRVRSVRVLREPGGGLGETAKQAMLREKWTAPIDHQGRPVATIITYKYTFELTG